MKGTVEPRRRRRRPGENRERLLAAALLEFGAYGYHGASTAGIAARAGVPQPHVYASFATKRELFLAVCQSVVERCTDDPERSAPENDAARFLFQAVGSSLDPSLNDALRAFLVRIEAALGAVGFEEMLTRGAHSLLRASEETAADGSGVPATPGSGVPATPGSVAPVSGDPERTVSDDSVHLDPGSSDAPVTDESGRFPGD